MDYLNFATRASSSGERSSQWRAITHVPHAELGDDREAAIRGCDLGEARLCRVAIGRHRIENTGLQDRLDEEAPVKFLFQEEGACSVEQLSRKISLLTGQWCAIDKAQPFSIESAGLSRQLAFSLPRRRVARWQCDTDRMLAPQGFLRGAGQVLHSSASAAISSSMLLGRRDRARLGTILVDLLNFARDADPLIDGTATRRSRRHALFSFVERNLTDPGLDVAAIAQALGYSKRTLHKLFADDATSVSRLIWERRLEHCRIAMLDPAYTRHSITEIAHNWGFSDSQHFSRAFKARFGASPREFRNTHLAY